MTEPSPMPDWTTVWAGGVATVIPAKNPITNPFPSASVAFLP
jgi:hypothetical protein